MGDYFGDIGFAGKSIKVETVIWIIILAIVVIIVAQFYLAYRPFQTEGFGGVARGAGHPDCLRELNDAAKVLDMVRAAAGQADYVEFQLILSKLSCLKKDLMSPSGIVEATRYQPYATSHDREPVAEVAATCLNKSVGQRDLDIIFVTWRDRGKVLLKRLCTVVILTEAQSTESEKLFVSAWNDVYSIALGRCIAVPAEQAAAAHDAQPYENPELEVLRPYQGYYSGWTGQI
jgi:hypothetical protein